MRVAEWTSIGFVLSSRCEGWGGDLPYYYSIDNIESCIFPTWKFRQRLRNEFMEMPPLITSAFGVPPWAEDLVAEMVMRKMCSDSRYIPPDGCLTRDALRDLIALGRLDISNAIVVEVGLHQDDVARIRKPTIPLHRLSASDFDNHPTRLAALEFGNAMHPEGEVIGFEPIVIDENCLLSWRHCPASEHMRIIEQTVNEYGFFDSEYLASQAAEVLGWNEPLPARDRPLENFITCNTLVMRHSSEATMAGAPQTGEWHSLIDELLESKR